MLSYSCNVRVVSVTPEDFGALATLELNVNDPGGIDIRPEPFQVQITEDAAQIVKEGAVLPLTLGGSS